MSKSIPPSPNIADYTQDPLYKKQIQAHETDLFSHTDPFALFSSWLENARAQELNDANAMALASLDENQCPDIRIVLLKSFNTKGFIFYTNANSAKATHITTHNKAALNFHWKSLRRQVRIRGTISKTASQDANAYFARRTRNAQLSAWASDQSSPMPHPQALQNNIKIYEEKFANQDIPRPPYWHGFLLSPTYFEFWREKPFRQHERLIFTQNDNNAWKSCQLYP